MHTIGVAKAYLVNDDGPWIKVWRRGMRGRRHNVR